MTDIVTANRLEVKSSRKKTQIVTSTSFRSNAYLQLRSYCKLFYTVLGVPQAKMCWKWVQNLIWLPWLQADNDSKQQRLWSFSKAESTTVYCPLKCFLIIKYSSISKAFIQLNLCDALGLVCKDTVSYQLSLCYKHIPCIAISGPTMVQQWFCRSVSRGFQVTCPRKPGLIDWRWSGKT